MKRGLKFKLSSILVVLAMSFVPCQAQGVFADVNGDGVATIKDVTALIDYLLSGDGSGINVDAADCNHDNDVRINDVTALIDYLLSGSW